MLRPGCYRLSSAAWGACALLAAAASAGPARAECGDYVHIGIPAAAGETPAPKPFAPCHGPHCSARPAPAAPLAPATPPTEPGPSDAILPVDPPADPGRSSRVGSPPVHLPAGPVTAIFHPPRLV